MSEQLVTTLPKSKRARKVKAARAPRVIDPGIAAIQARMRTEIAAYRRQKGSAGILKTILTKRLPQLNAADKMRLMDALQQQVTPAMPFLGSPPITPEETTTAPTTGYVGPEARYESSNT
ncbi:MAG: hypothetical protein ACOYD4_04090 [Solirubrobacterales bacterium]